MTRYRTTIYRDRLGLYRYRRQPATGGRTVDASEEGFSDLDYLRDKVTERFPDDEIVVQP